MDWLPEEISQQFEAVCYGMPTVLSQFRQANRNFLHEVFEALQQEERFTVLDVAHLGTLMWLADLLKLPEWWDTKSLVAAESYLLKQLPDYPGKQVRFCLEYLYYLLVRQGRVQPETNAANWFLIWRVVSRFPECEQGIVFDFIQWLLKNQFSSVSILDRVRELQIFRAWMELQGIDSIGGIVEETALQYLQERSQACRAITCQRIGVNVQAFFDYYRERIDGRFPLMILSRFRSASGHGMDANSDEVQQLWNALKEGALPAEIALMLIFVVGMGLPLKVLPLLRLTVKPGKLVYNFQRPSRQGVSENELELPLEEPWIFDYWARFLNARMPINSPYLFTSWRSNKKRQPVSSNYCRRKLEKLVEEILGYPIAVNRLERGSLKAVAGGLDFDTFMRRVQNVPLGRTTKLFIWLDRNSNAKGKAS